MGMERARELVPIVKEALQKIPALAKTLCLLHLTAEYVGGLAYLHGESMLPTIDHNLAISERISARLGRVGSGDVVIVKHPDHPTRTFTKRIKAVGGDVVSFSPDPNRIDEKKTVVVPEGHVWVEGDNASNSRDSRHFGAVPYALIHSRVFFVLWPLKDIKLVRNEIL